MTFYASDDKLETVGLKDKSTKINRNAVLVHREVAREGDALVAATSRSPGRTTRPTRGAARPRPRAVRPAAPGQCSMRGCRPLGRGDVQLPRSPAVRRARQGDGPARHGDDSFEDPSPCVQGDTPGDCARKLAGAGADIVGVNCLNGPSSSSRSPSRCGRRSTRTSPRSRSRIGRRTSGPTSRRGRTSRIASRRCSSRGARWRSSPRRPMRPG